MSQSKPYNERIIFYIVVHSPAIIEAFEREGKYSKLPKYKYVWVGKHEEDHTSELIIQCDRLICNDEMMKHWLAYTGWRAVATHPIIPDDVDYVCFLEYDSDICVPDGIDAMIENIFKEDKKVYGMFSLPVSNSFLEYSIFSKGLVDFLKSENIREINQTIPYG